MGIGTNVEVTLLSNMFFSIKNATRSILEFPFQATPPRIIKIIKNIQSSTPNNPCIISYK